MKKSLLIIAAFILISANVTPASANQRSIDKDLIETYKKLTDRSENHEERVTQLVVKRDTFGKSLEEKHKELSKLPETDTTAGGRQRRYTLQAEVNKLIAQYVKVSYDILFSAEELLSENLNDIVKLTNRLHNSPGSRSQILKIQRQIERDTRVGKMMRKNLMLLTRYSSTDPAMKAKVKDLTRIMRNLDHGITIAKSKFPKSRSNKRNQNSTRRVEALKDATRRLQYELAKIRTQKTELDVIKDEIGYNNDLWRLGQVYELSHKAVPQLNLPGLLGGGSEAPFSKLKNVVIELGDRIKQSPRFNEDKLDKQQPQATSEPGVTPKNLKFRNF